MKKNYLLSKHLYLLFFLQFTITAYTQNYVSIPIQSGFNADVIANGIGPASNTTNADIDGLNFAFVANGYQLNPSSPPFNSGLPPNGILYSAVSTTPTLQYQLASYYLNNCLRLASKGSTGTLEFSTPFKGMTLYVLATSGSGPTTVDADIHFTDQSTQTVNGLAVPDWFGGSNYAVRGIGRINLYNDAIELGSDTNPRIYQIPIVVAAENNNKEIKSITFTKTGTNTDRVTTIFALSADLYNLCTAPQNITSEAGMNNASIVWTAASSSPSGGYDYYLSTTNSTPSVSAVPTGNVSDTALQLNSLTVGETYYLWIRSNCGTGSLGDWKKHSFTTAMISSVYNDGDISTLYSTGITAASTTSCPGLLSISVPSGYQIKNTLIEYTMTTSGTGLKSNQRSLLVCLNNGRTESTVSSGSGTNGSFLYQRTGISIANGLTGTINYELRAWRTNGGAGCSTDYNKVDNNTWKITVTLEPSDFKAVKSQTNVSCHNGDNGSAAVNVTGGSGNYTYSWAPYGGTTATASGLKAGVYTITIKDSNGSWVDETFTITEPPALIAAADSQNNVSCNGGSNGSAAVTVTGGTGTYTYLWAPSGGTNAATSGLSAGTYTVTIKDANLCTTTQSFTITEPAALVAPKVKTDVSCKTGSNGSATVNVTGGTGAYTYQWAPSGGTAATASGLSAGTYTVTIKDANLCQTTASVTILEPTILTAAISKTDILCNQANDGTATVTPSGGTAPYTYSWSPSGGATATASGLSPNTYTVTVTDANGCFITETAQITEPTSLSITDSHINISCKSGNDGTASVAVAGGKGSYTYLWLPSGGTASTATSLSPGIYTVTVTDENSCSTVKSIIITEPDILTVAATAANVSCHNGNNGSASASVIGGTGVYSYLWSPSGGTNATATNLAAGTYTVIVTDANSCSASGVVEVKQPVNPVNLDSPILSGVTVSGASISYTVSSDGIDTDKGECLTEIGFVYASHASPSIADSKINASATLGTFTNTLSGLRGNRTYYVRTYAINSNGFIAYGNEVNFTTDKYNLTITSASDYTKVYGTPDPVFNYTVTGFANGDTNAVISGQLSRETGENAGKYNIKSGSLNAGSDYTITFTETKFEITKANQTINWNQTLEFGCDDSSVTALTAITDSGLPVSYTIANPIMGTISGTTLTILKSGSTTITAFQNGDQNHNETNVLTKPIEINQSGLITQQWADVLFFDNKTNNFTAYQWYKNGNAITTATRQYYNENQPLNGSYYVIATDKSGKSIKSCPIEVTGNVFSKKLKIHPNPVKPSNQFTLECDFNESQLNGAQIKIFDITGKLVQNVLNVKANTLITAPSQSAIYVVVLMLSNGQIKTINLLVK